MARKNLVGNQLASKMKATNLHIGYTPELLEQVSGNEREDGVLGGDNLVRSILCPLQNLALCIKELWRQLLVDVDIARSTGRRWT